LRTNLEGHPCLLSSGAPDSVRCPIPFLKWRSRPLQIWEPLAHPPCPVHTGQSGAPFRPLAWPRVARRIRGGPLARPTVGSPDSPVHTGQSGEFLAVRRQQIPESGLFGRVSLAHRTLSGAPPDSPVHHRTVRCSRPNNPLAVHSQLFFDSISPVSSS
jgi:hypothetical protein